MNPLFTSINGRNSRISNIMYYLPIQIHPYTDAIIIRYSYDEWIYYLWLADFISKSQISWFLNSWPLCNQSLAVTNQNIE